jgi:hypothetical protein
MIFAATPLAFDRFQLYGRHIGMKKRHLSTILFCLGVFLILLVGFDLYSRSNALQPPVEAVEESQQPIDLNEQFQSPIQLLL